jgi:hypothetical protein
LPTRRLSRYKQDLAFDSEGRLEASKFTLYLRSPQGSPSGVDRYDRSSLAAARATERHVNARFFAAESKAAGRDAFLMFTRAPPLPSCLCA